MRRSLIWAAVAGLLLAGPAAAGHLTMGPTVVTSAPYRIAAIAPPRGVLTATVHDPLLVQPLAPLGTVILDGEVSAGAIINPFRLSAGTPVFLAIFADGDAYCGVAVAGVATLCLADSAHSGHFDRIGVARQIPSGRGSRTSFNGMPLVFFPPSGFKPLSVPIAYHAAAGPPTPPTTVEVRWAPWRGPAKSNIGLGLMFRSGKIREVPHTDAIFALGGAGTTVVKFQGAVIEVISLSDKVLTYRVVSAMPTHDATLTATFNRDAFHWAP